MNKMPKYNELTHPLLSALEKLGGSQDAVDCQRWTFPNMPLTEQIETSTKETIPSKKTKGGC